MLLLCDLFRLVEGLLIFVAVISLCCYHGALCRPGMHPEFVIGGGLTLRLCIIYV